MNNGSQVTDLDDYRVRKAGGCWLLGPESCPCGHEIVGIVPSMANTDALECAGCGQMTARLDVAMEFPTAAAAVAQFERWRDSDSKGEKMCGAWLLP